MLAYTVKRLLAIIPMLLAISVLVFFGLELIPGDPINRMVPPDTLGKMTDSQIEALRESLGLSDPAIVRYFRWLNDILHGDFGYSIVHGTPITQMMRNRLPATIELCSVALLISTVLGIVLGLLSSVFKNTIIDYSATIFGALGLAVPDFFVGLIAVLVFIINLKVLPAGGRIVYGTGFIGRLPNLILPAGVLGFGLTAVLMRYTRGSMLDVLGKDYVKTARSKGLREGRVIVRHAFRNALMPVVLLLCFRLPMLIGGSVVIETIFGWGGMGTMITSATAGNDYPVVLFTVMCTSAVVLLASLLVDILTAALDPRVRIK